jgi:hypothetical protein
VSGLRHAVEDYLSKRDTRQLPLHHSTVDALVAYTQLRDQHRPRPKTSALFVSMAGTRLLQVNVNSTFRLLVARPLMDRDQDDQERYSQTTGCPRTAHKHHPPHTEATLPRDNSSIEASRSGGTCSLAVTLWGCHSGPTL